MTILHFSRAAFTKRQNVVGVKRRREQLVAFKTKTLSFNEKRNSLTGSEFPFSHNVNQNRTSAMRIFFSRQLKINNQSTNKVRQSLNKSQAQFNNE